jgi:cytochrome c5
MKKYVYNLCLLGVIVYSCKTQTTTPTVSTATANLTKEEMLKKGEDLFNLKCGRCHGLPSPSEFTIADWQPIMSRMAPKAKLNTDETNWVLAYVNANAKKL